MSSFRKEFIVTPEQILVRKHLKYSSGVTSYKIYGAWIILTLACVILSAIIIHNHWRYGREEKSSISPPNILIKKRIKVESKSRQLRAGQTRENRHKECEQKVNKLFHDFIKDLIFNPIYQDLYTAVHQLKCVFLKLNEMKSLPVNHLACENPASTKLDFKSKASIIDWNLKNHVALKRYIITLDEMRSSLTKITKMERNVQPNIRTNYAYLTDKVDKKLLSFRNTMQSIEKGYIGCGYDPDNSKAKLDIFMEFDNESLIKQSFTAEERAGNVFKQMEKLFYTIKEDMIHRRKCSN